MNSLIVSNLCELRIVKGIQDVNKRELLLIGPGTSKSFVDTGNYAELTVSDVFLLMVRRLMEGRIPTTITELLSLYRCVFVLLCTQNYI